MKLRSICSEAIRNISSGTAHVFTLTLAVLSASTLLGGYEAVSVVGLEQEAIARIHAKADVMTFVSENIDGEACDRLVEAENGPSVAGAVRDGPQVTPLSTPGKGLSSYEVTPSLVPLLMNDVSTTAADISGIWVSSSVSQDFGLIPGSILETDHGDMKIANIFEWPNDGRDTRFAYAIIVPSSSVQGWYDECWAKIWPDNDDLKSLLYSTGVPTGNIETQVGVTRLNKGFDSHYSAYATYSTRITRFVPWLGCAVGIFIGVFAVLRRRLEYAGALHCGQRKHAQLLGMLLETCTWAGLGATCSTSIIVAYCARFAFTDTAAVILGAIRSPIATFCGALFGVFTAGLFIRESQLFRFFKQR